MKEVSSVEMTLRDVLRIFFRYKLIIISAFLTIMTSVYISMELRTQAYQSSVTILVSGKMQKDLEVQRDLGPGSLIETQMQLVMSKPILERTVEALKLYQLPPDYERKFTTRLKGLLIDHYTKKSKDEFEKMTSEQKRKAFFNNAVEALKAKIITVPIGKASSMFLIMVTDFDPFMAGEIANVLSRSYVIFDLEQQIAELHLTYGEKNETIRKLENHISQIEETLDGRIIPDIEAIGPASVKIVAQAGSGWELPMRPTTNSALVAAFIMSMVVGFVLAFAFDFMDQTIKSPHDLKKYLNINYLGSIPKKKSRDSLMVQHVNPVSRYTLSCRSLSNRIYLSMKDKNFKSVLLTYIEGAEETAISIASLGICMSHNTGYRVLIIDADLRSPSIHKIFNITDTMGLTDVLGEKINFENAIHDLGSNLSILPAGQTEVDPSILLGSSRMLDIMNNTKELYDIILVNCSDIKNYTDVFTILSCIDCMALFINEGKVRRQVVINSIAPFEQRKTNIIGGILNNHKHVIPEIIYRLT